MARFITSTLLIFLVSFAFAQKPVTYKLDLDNIQHHELKISVEFTDIDSGSFEIRMPNSSPGRYAEHNFAKNVYEEKAFDENGDRLKVIRTTPFSWKIESKDNYVRFEYTLYGNHGDGTYTGIDARKLHMNMPATFIYGVGLDDRPIALSIDLEDYTEWTVATQLQHKDNVYSAPNYYYFYDSPTIVGDIDWRRWEVDNQTIEIAMMHEGTDAELDAYAEWVKRIVEKEIEVFGELPQFDFNRYTFLVSYNPWIFGDGMEHRNSTICSSSGNLAEHADRLIGTISHEFFHAWNVERIRPETLEPFDFDNANLSGELWFAEGFTSYYDDLVLCRAGIMSPKNYVSGLAGSLNYVVNSPGRTIRNPIQMSQNAPFVDAATSNDETNYGNNFISYYSYGAVLGLGLDLTLRTKFKDVTLDDYMKYIWLKYGKTEIPYTIENLRSALAAVTGDQSFAQTFFDQYIYSSEMPDFKSLFESFGIQWVQEDLGKAYFGNIRLSEELTIQNAVARGTALYEAGIERGDKLLSIDGMEITNPQDLDSIVNRIKIKSAYKITYEQMGIEKSGEFIAKPDPRISLTYLDGDELKRKVLTKRKSWLDID